MSSFVPPFTTRRHFLRNSLSTAAVMSASNLHAAAATNGARPVRFGFVGCGGRGTFVAGIVKENPGLRITAAADYFQDRVDAFGEAFGVPQAERYTGLDGIHKLIASGNVDAVAVHSTPCFHVEHARAAVAAGKHVLVAKPVAIDVPGCEEMRKLAREAAEKGIVVYVDVQCRGDAFFQEALQRVRGGAIGDLRFGDCNYEADLIRPLSDEKTPEARLRNWVRYRDLGGDIITEQNIHALDIVSWAFGNPVRVSGLNGRGARPDNEVGDTSDHYSLHFEFERGAVNFSSRQFNAWGLQFRCENRFVGTKGALLTNFGGRVMIRGGRENFWAGGESKNLYRTGSVSNVEHFRRQVVARAPEGNATVDAAAQTTLLTLIGKAAGDARGTVTWDDFLRDAKSVKPDLTGLKA